MIAARTRGDSPSRPRRRAASSASVRILSRGCSFGFRSPVVGSEVSRPSATAPAARRHPVGEKARDERDESAVELDGSGSEVSAA